MKYVVCIERSKNIYYDHLHLPCKFFAYQLNTHKVMALVCLCVLNDNFLPFCQSEQLLLTEE